MSDYLDVLWSTWPAAKETRVGVWTIRAGRGGGKRVSAATATAPATATDLAQAEQAMRALDQEPLFMIRAQDAMLDALLQDNGYQIVDPVTVYAAPLSELTTQRPPAIAAFTLWEPLEIMKEIWAGDGIGPSRLAVMARVSGPKTSVLGRIQNRAAGAAFAAIHENTAMVHAMVVENAYRRQGTAVNMMREAAFWAQDQGASELAVVVTDDNADARALYASLNMQPVGHYHYRKKQC